MLFFNEFKSICKKFIYLDSKTTSLTKWKQSLMAIFVALMLTSILILIKGENPIVIFRDIIIGATNTPESWSTTWLYFAMFILAGAAVIVGFKAGLFNIGIGGQMLISGTIVMILAVKTSIPWFVLLLLAMIIASAAAAISGVLKALFNIHEVVSSILLNWIFFYITQYLLGNDMSWMNGFGSTKEIKNISRMNLGNSIATPALLVTTILLVFFIFIFKYTKLGYSLKSIGENKDASKYAGINVFWQIVFAMALSGLAAGALASVNYLGKFGSISRSVGKTIPAIGFQGISVALIAFKNLMGLIPAALFWAIISSGTDYASIVNPNIPKEILTLMNGFIIYSIAISIIFIRFKPISIIYKLYLKIKSPEYKKERQKCQKAISEQKKSFAKASANLKKYENNEINNKLKTTSKQLFKIKLKKKIFIKKYIKKNKKMFFLEFLIHKRKKYKNVFSKYKEYKLQYLIKLNKKMNNLILKENTLFEKQKKLLQQTTNYKINTVNKQLKDAKNIIKRENKQRIKILFAQFYEKNIFRKLIVWLNIRKIEIAQFYEQEAYLILNCKKNVKLLKKNSSSKTQLKKQIAKIKQNFWNERNQMWKKHKEKLSNIKFQDFIKLKGGA